MLRTLAVTQMRLMLRDGRVRLLLVAFSLLSAIALLAGWQRDQALIAERQQATQADGRLWLAQGAVNPHMAAHFGRDVFKPIGPLAAFDPGLSDQLGTVARLEAHVQNTPRHRPAEGDGAVARFQAVHPAYLLQLMLPLLLILSGFAFFRGERTEPLVRQELASGVPARSLVLGRLIALLVVFGLALLPVAVAMWVHSAMHGADAAQGALALVAGYGLYLAIWAALVVATAAACRSARTCVVVLLALWAASVMLVPRLASDIAAVSAPAPGTAQFKAALRKSLEQGPSGHDGRDVRLEALKRATLRKHGVSRIEDLPVNWDGIALLEGERYAAEVARQHYDTLWAAWRAQDQIRRGFALLSPTIALQNWSAALAGTDAESHIHFVEKLEAYRFAFVQRLNEDIAANAAAGKTWDYTAGPALLESVKGFEHQPLPLGQTLRQALPDFVVLAVWSAAALGLALLCASRLRG